MPTFPFYHDNALLKDRHRTGNSSAEGETVPAVVSVRRVDICRIHVQVVGVGGRFSRTRPGVPVVASVSDSTLVKADSIATDKSQKTNYELQPKQRGCFVRD